MLDHALLETLELLSPEEQKAIQIFAEYLKSHRSPESTPQSLTKSVLDEMSGKVPAFQSPDEGISPARLAARRFMRENPALMHLLAQ